jgi:hypothetical protein
MEGSNSRRTVSRETVLREFDLIKAWMLNAYAHGCGSFFCTQEGGGKIGGKDQEREAAG